MMIAAGPKKTVRVLVVIGQSNATGAATGTPASPAFRADTWLLRKSTFADAATADDGTFARMAGIRTLDMPDETGGNWGNGIEIPLMPLLAARYPNSEWVILKSTKGSTSMNEWHPAGGSGARFRQAVAYIREGLRKCPASATVTAIYWSQGEGDASGAQAQYGQNEREMFAALRLAIPALATVPILSIIPNYTNYVSDPGNVGRDVIAAAKVANEAMIPGYRAIDISSLVYGTDYNPDTIHTNAAGFAKKAALANARL